MFCFSLFFSSAEARCAADARKDEAKKAQEVTGKLKQEMQSLKAQQTTDKKQLEDTRTEADGLKKQLDVLRQDSDKKQQSIETLKSRL